jgi:catechol-2,3-dioxygenase
MIRIADIDHVVLRVSELAPMVAFYRDVLGCPVERVQAEIGLWQLRAGRALIDLLPGREPGPGSNLDHVCLRLQTFDLEAIRTHLGAHGVAVGAVAERFGAEGRGPSLYITDPEGNTVELKGPAGHAG